ncbi:type II toxin-antitoxin system VapC family toxin [Sinorhizobium meliloti]|jgi:predicted nucleic acid-binding protein|uniref:type II toxin-antitoxin system VapC family toxin n=1 Tax=Rhizobium meliloti TaxID=382 RepID=UPI0020C03354|nr:type II toxin-antitoxin system VapC family toxin [Sinorhizobium meliloti]
MRLIDSSAWIEWFIDGPLAERLAEEIPEQSECLVPTMVQHELRKWFLRERDEDTADEIIAFTELCTVIPLDTRLALLAAEIARQHRLATADAIIYASASLHGAELVTHDAHFKNLPGVILLPKTTN